MKNKMFASPLLLSVILLMLCCSNVSSAWASAATTTSLAVTSGGNTVTTVSSGTAITLTATVTAAGAPVTAGTVNFCDASVTYCTDLHLLGAAALSSNGTATLKLIPAIGAHSYKAVFAGTTGDDASSSAASSLQVTGKYSTSTSLAVNTEAATQTYSLTATVAGNGNPPGQPAPSGSVSFQDASNGNAVLDTANLVAGPAGLNWTSPTTLTNETPALVQAADFNLDGVSDFFTCDCSDGNFLTVFLGKGDGTFTRATAPPSISGFQAIVNALFTGDFNHDGKPDIAAYVQNNLETSVNTEIVVLLGNGDGTFTEAPITVVSDTSELEGSAAAGDFNRDGLLDIAITDSIHGAVTLFLGNGDGTFTPAASSIAIGNGPGQIVAGDFNNDGNADLAVSLTKDNTIAVLLDNGDGTFTTAPDSPAGSLPFYFLVAADFNGDGKLDLAAQDSTTTITVLLGNGDGTFTAAPAATTSVVPLHLAIGDFNGDGKVDLATDYKILLGDGTGRFTELSSSPMPNAYLAAGDWNRDGITDLLAQSNLVTTTVLLTHLAAPASATVSGVTLPTTAKVFAHYPGDSVYNASASVTMTPPPFVPMLTISPNSLSFGNQIINTQSDVKNITLTNTGSAILTFGPDPIHIGLAVSPDGWGTQFATSNNCGPTLAVNASCVIRVRFAPLATGGILQILAIEDNAHGAPQELGISGTGTASPITLSSNRVEFGKQAVGTSSAVQQVTLTNTSTASINLSSIWWNGAPAGTFAVSSTCGATLAPSASCTVRMRFDPKATGLVRSVVYITNNATTTPLQIGMAGTGVTP